MDRLFALLALAVFIAFLAVIAVFVPEPDMVVVFAFVTILVIYDFWQTIGAKRSRDQAR